MQEQIRPQNEQFSGPAGLGDIFDHEQGDRLVAVSSGPYAEHLPVGHWTVGEVRRRFGSRLDIDPRSQAVVDGVDVGDDTIVRPGQALMFTRRAGEKGV